MTTDPGQERGDELGASPLATGLVELRSEPQERLGHSATIPSAGVDWCRLLPKYWFQNESTDRVWDAVLNIAITKFGVSKCGRHTCQIGPFNVWISNWPYAYGSVYEGSGPEGLPMVRTRQRLRRAVSEVRIADLESFYASAMSARSDETACGLSPQDASAVGDSRDAQGDPS